MVATHRHKLLIGSLAAVLLFVSAWLAGEPQDSVQCWWQQRNGWELEFPGESLPEQEFRDAIEAQTQCVDLTVAYVNTRSVPDGHVVEPIGTREWIEGGGTLNVLVERRSGSEVVECGQPLREPATRAAAEVLSCGNEVSPPTG